MHNSILSKKYKLFFSKKGFFYEPVSTFFDWCSHCRDYFILFPAKFAIDESLGKKGAFLYHCMGRTCKNIYFYVKSLLTMINIWRKLFFVNELSINRDSNYIAFLKGYKICNSLMYSHCFIRIIHCRCIWRR